MVPSLSQDPARRSDRALLSRSEAVSRPLAGTSQLWEWTLLVDNKLSVSYCSLLTGAAWILGLCTYVLIGFEVVPLHFSGLAMVPLIGGSVLYVRGLIKRMERSLDAAFQMGRKSAEITPLRLDR